MFRIDDATAVAVKPAPTPEGAPGYFTKGDPLGGIPATVLTADWANNVQEEIVSVISDAAVTPAIPLNKANSNLLVTAIKRLIGIKATETVQGTAEVATQAETNAGTDDERIVTPKKLRAGFAAVLGVNGYIAFPSWLGALVIQWGRVTATTQTGTVTFPIAFPNACWSLLGGLVPVAASDKAYTFSFSGITVAQATFYKSGNNLGATAEEGRWIAIGN